MTTLRSIAFPLTLSGGNLATKTDDQVVAQAIMHVLSIQPTEYLMRSSYGVPARIFDSVTNADEIIRDIEARLRSQVGADYPTVSIQCSGEFGESGILDLKVEWELNGLSQPSLSLRIA